MFVTVIDQELTTLLFRGQHRGKSLEFDIVLQLTNADILQPRNLIIIALTLRS